MKRTIEIDDILNSAKNALKLILDDAEKRDYSPPAHTEAVAELEYVIHEIEYRDA